MSNLPTRTMRRFVGTSLSRWLFVHVLCFATAAVVLLSGFPRDVMAQSGSQISLSPLVLELSGQRGTNVPFSISLINHSSLQTVRFKAYVAGLTEGRRGDYSPAIPDEGLYAASSWITLEQDAFEIPPGSGYELKGTVTIPRDAPPSGYATIIMELQPEERIGSAALSIEYIQQFVTAVEIVVGNRHVRSAHIDSMTVIPSRSVPEYRAAFGDNAVVFVGSLFNDGDVHVSGRGTLIIRDERGRRVREVPLGGGRGVVLPQAVVDFVSVLRGLSPGKYEMQTIIDYGGARPAIGRMQFELGDEEVGVSQIVAGRAVRIDAGPTLLQYEFPRPGYRAQTITVVNRDDVEVEVAVSLEELANDEGGEPIVVEPGVVMPYSAVAWGEVRPATFTLRPGQRRNVVVGFRTPEGVTGGRYARVRIEGRTSAVEDGGETASSEIVADALLMLGTEFSPLIRIVEVDWQPVSNQGILAAGAAVVNEGDIHGPAGLRLTLMQYTPETEEEQGDFIVITPERWDIVDTTVVESGDVILLPGQQRFVFGVFEQHTLEKNREYQILVEALGRDGARTDSSVVDFWIDDTGTMYDGRPDHLTGDDEG